MLAALLAYANSFAGPFIYDDIKSIPENPSIRSLGGFMAVFSPPLSMGETVGGRPLLELSFALNYALGGENVWGYHAVNLLIHVLAALVLFDLVRRTFLQPALRERYVADALLLAWAMALLWAVHPLQTESVTYIVQRAESLAGLFYLATLYGFVRAAQAERPRGWLILSLACCYLGVGTKETIVTAPLLVLLYDRTFVAGSFGEAWRQRKIYYLGVAGSWVILAAIIFLIGSRGETVGSVTGVSWPVYAQSETFALVHYLALAIWPAGLALNYGPAWIRSPWQALPYAAIIFLLLAGAIVALRRTPTSRQPWPALGLLGAWFFLILAPTSLVPEKDMLFEHRMYLPLAAVLVGLVLLVHRVAGRRGVLLALLFVAPALIVATRARNNDYRSDLAIWSDCAARRPENPLAADKLGIAFTQLNRLSEAEAQFRRAIALDPANAEYRCNLGAVLERLGRGDEAVGQYRQALALDPNIAHAYGNWGVVLVRAGHATEAMAMFRKAILLDPHYAEPENDLGVLLDDQGRMPEAIEHFRAAVRIDPTYVDGLNNLGDALGATGHFTEAAAQYRAALAIDPRNVSSHYNLGIALAELRQFPEAAAEFQMTLQLDPANAAAQAALERLRPLLQNP